MASTSSTRVLSQHMIILLRYWFVKHLSRKFANRAYAHRKSHAQVS